jgi:hypothetical protein
MWETTISVEIHFGEFDIRARRPPGQDVPPGFEFPVSNSG